MELGSFWYCSNLTSVSIPDSVTHIGNNAFTGCAILRDIYYGGSKEDAGKIKIVGRNSELTNEVWHYKQ